MCTEQSAKRPKYDFDPKDEWIGHAFNEGRIGIQQLRSCLYDLDYCTVNKPFTAAAKRFRLDPLQFLSTPSQQQSWLDLNTRTLIITPKCLINEYVEQMIDVVNRGTWVAGMCSMASGLVNGMDVLIDHDIRREFKPDIDHFFDCYQFGVVRPEYLPEELMTNDTMDFSYFEGVSPIFDYSTLQFLSWGEANTVPGYSIQVPIPVGPEGHRWKEYVCWTVVKPHLWPPSTSKKETLPPGDSRLTAMKRDREHLTLTVAHPQRECAFNKDFTGSVAHAYDDQLEHPNSMGSSRARQHPSAAQRQAEAEAAKLAAWNALEADDADVEEASDDYCDMDTETDKEEE